MAVIWRDIRDYEGMYQVSSNGQVRSLDRVVDDKGGERKIPERILKPILNRHGYLYVTLSKESETKKHFIHRLVGETSLENFKNKETINHMDGDKTNNNLWNLFWATQRENVIHAHENGLGKGKHLSHDEAETVRSMYQAGGISQKELSDQFGVSQVTICNVINRKRGYTEKQLTAPRNTFPNWEKYA